MTTPQVQQSPRRLRLWSLLHWCPVCHVDRVALGHYRAELGVPYSSEDLIAHLGACARDGTFDDEVEPF